MPTGWNPMGGTAHPQFNTNAIWAMYDRMKEEQDFMLNWHNAKIQTRGDYRLTVWRPDPFGPIWRWRVTHMRPVFPRIVAQDVAKSEYAATQKAEYWLDQTEIGVVYSAAVTPQWVWDFCKSREIDIWSTAIIPVATPDVLGVTEAKTQDGEGYARYIIRGVVDHVTQIADTVDGVSGVRETHRRLTLRPDSLIYTSAIYLDKVQWRYLYFNSGSQEDQYR